MYQLTLKQKKKQTIILLNLIIFTIMQKKIVFSQNNQITRDFDASLNKKVQSGKMMIYSTILFPCFLAHCFLDM